MQPGRWIAEARWPSANIAPHRLYLSPKRLAATAEVETALTHCSVQYNGRASGAWCPYATGADLDSDQQVDDGHSLVFDSLPLAARLEILGAPTIELELAVDRPFAFVAARLCDVDTRGGSARVTYGVLNLTHRDSHGRRRDAQFSRLPRGRLQEVEISAGDGARPAELANDLEPRRGEIDLLVVAMELDRNAPAYRDALDLLEEIDVEIGAPKLTVGDAAQADRLLHRYSLANGAILDLAERRG